MQQASSRLYGMILLRGLVNQSAYGQSQADIAAQQIPREQQRERAQNEQAEEPRPAVRLPREPVKAAAVYPLDETPCFPIRHIALRTALPARPGDILNLRDIEQALENFKRVPTAEADIEIVPGEQPGESDLLIKWRQARPVPVGEDRDIALIFRLVQQQNKKVALALIFQSESARFR